MVLLYLKKHSINDRIPFIPIIRKKGKSSILYSKNKSGINCLKKKTVLRKGRTLTKIKYLKNNLLFLQNHISCIMGFGFAYKRKKIITLCLNSVGSWFFVNSSVSDKIGFFIKFKKNRYLKYTSSLIFNTINFIKYCRVFVKYSFLWNKKKKKQIATSAGSVFTILNFVYKNDKFLVLLPSKKKTILSGIDNYVAYFNPIRKANPVRTKKAGSLVIKGLKPVVRGCVKNPNDHPHGGRTRNQYQYMSPWGKIHKNNK